jgi:hypothetical protein
MASVALVVFLNRTPRNAAGTGRMLPWRGPSEEEPSPWPKPIA